MRSSKEVRAELEPRLKQLQDKLGAFEAKYRTLKEEHAELDKARIQARNLFIVDCVHSNDNIH
jgi:hypothetical protein